MEHRVGGGLFHFLLLFMIKADGQRQNRAQGVKDSYSAAADTLYQHSFMFPESLTQPVSSQFLPNMIPFDRKCDLQETAETERVNTV